MNRLLRFGVVGTLGFALDATVLLGLLAFTALDPYLARIPAFLAAATLTWALNRTWTFSDARRRRAVGQWARWIGAMVLGALVNYGTYAALITVWAVAGQWPVLGVAAGSLAGLLVNYTLARRFVFAPES